jgi:hypothetical protein
MLSWKTTFLTAVFHDFLQSLEANAGKGEQPSIMEPSMEN